MALRSLSEIRNLEDPLKQSQAEFVITDLPGLTLAAVSQKVAGLISGNTQVASSEELRLRCTSFSYPSPKIKQSEVVISGFIRRRGTIQDKSGTWRCKVTEDQGGGVLNLIQAWCDLIHSHITGTRVPSTAYVGTAQITLGGDCGTPKRTIWMRGFYPIGYKVNDINLSSSDAVDVDLEFSYDYYADNSYSLFSLF